MVATGRGQAACPADLACCDACADCGGWRANRRPDATLEHDHRSEQQPETARQYPSVMNHVPHAGGVSACGPGFPCLPSGALPRRHGRRDHAKRDGRRCGIARLACPYGAWTSCRPCALPPTPRQIAALRRLRGLPRSFSIAPRKSRKVCSRHSFDFCVAARISATGEITKFFLIPHCKSEIFVRIGRVEFFQNGYLQSASFCL